MAEAAKQVEKFVFPDEKDEKVDDKQDLDISVEGETDVAIEVVDDTPPEDRGRKPGEGAHIPDADDAELAAYTEGVQKRIKELSFARQDERRAKEAALRREEESARVARAVLEENQRLKQSMQTGQETYATAAKAAAEAKLDNAKRKYKDAHEAFDADALIAAQQELTAAQWELMQAASFKPAPLQEEKGSVYSQPTQSPRPDERVVRWAQRNPWFGSNKRLTAYALTVHQELVDSGVDPRTDEYYQQLDAEMRQTFPKETGASQSAGEPTSTPHRKPASVVAPTARSSSAKKIVLTQTQVQLARKFGLTNEQYAQHVALLEKSNGR